MISYKPVPFKMQLGAAALVPPPSPDVLYTGFTGVPGAVETFAVLGVSAAAAWAGIRTGMRETNSYVRAAGWIGGIGSVLIGLLYLGAKSGVGQMVGIPAVRISPV